MINLNDFNNHTYNCKINNKNISYKKAILIELKSIELNVEAK